MNKLLLALFLALAPTALASTKWYVDGVHGSDSNNCKTRQTACKTIGHAIALASSGDTIGVGPATYTENLTMRINLTIVGSGASTTIIDGGGINSVVTKLGGVVTLSGVTIRNGRAKVGGGINNNSGNLTVNRSTIAGNKASPGDDSYGGGIYNGAGLTINNSTINENVSNGLFGYGGGIFNEGTAIVNNSTVSGNSAHLLGGGIATSGTLTINNSTISYNYGGVAIEGSGTATLQNSIVANSIFFGNCHGTMTSLGYNLSSDSSCNFTGRGDLNNTDPKLGPLQNNGGPTQTQALLPGSPSIDAGNPNGCTDGNGNLLKTDQRGKPRPDREDKTGCDMGGYERQKD